ncbi:hypothetical protein HPB51_008271 [Rhipicephalus microplus]|uniref:Uncharacterized protein n=1 Tax=Rhipicephalus microplus TaxID=6941 RepID=A0A9J6EYS3_RHIMP|nr:hypothetical protein HPB51_008271 [Rhipicephalus microplus]
MAPAMSSVSAPGHNLDAVSMIQAVVRQEIANMGISPPHQNTPATSSSAPVVASYRAETGAEHNPERRTSRSPSPHLQRLEKSPDELAKANEALHGHMTNDEVLADMDLVLEYEDRTAGSVGLLKHHIQKLAVRTSGPARFNEEHGLLRIQTRLRNVEYHEGMKYPILLPGDHIATELIATGLHQRLLHARVPTTVAELRELFWVTKSYFVLFTCAPKFGYQ